MILDEWSKIYFGDIATFKNGLNFVKSDEGDQVKYIGVGDFKSYFRLRSTKGLAYAQISGKIKPDELLKDGDLLFVRSNGNKDLVGRCLLIDNLVEPVAYSGFTIRARLKSKEILPEFIAHVFRSRYIKSQMLEAGGGTNISNLSQDILSTIEILLPPLPEQKKIAEILGSWDTAIEQLETLIEKKQLLKRGLMQKLLSGKVRFPEFEGEAWEFSTIEKYYRYINRYTDWDDKNTYKQVIVRRWSQGIEDRNELKGEDIKVKKLQTIKNGDFLISNIQAAYGATFLVSQDHDGKFVSDLYTILESRDERSRGFIHFFSQSKKMEHLIIQSSNGFKAERIRLNFDPEVFMKQILFFPTSLEEQKKIADVLFEVDQGISGLQKQLQALKKQKLGLMQQLLTGKRRV